MKIGLAVGHSRKGDEGAMTFLESGYSISEFMFNSDLVRRIAPALTMDYVIYNDYKDPTYVGAVDYLAQKLIDDEVDAEEEAAREADLEFLLQHIESLQTEVWVRRGTPRRTPRNRTS